MPEHNRRFARPAAEPEDYQGRKPSARELRAIFRLETERSIGNDWVLRYAGWWWQLEPQRRRYAPAQSKALVCEYQDGAREVYYRGERIRFHEIAAPMAELPERRAGRGYAAR